jgi:hypothetical protein
MYYALHICPRLIGNSREAKLVPEQLDQRGWEWHLALSAV